jgi:predicted ATPase
MAVDTAAIRERPGRFDVAGLATSRLDALPPASRQLVEATACLGGRAEASLVEAAIAEPAR